MYACEVEEVPYCVAELSLNSADELVFAGGEEDPIATDKWGILCDPEKEGPVFCDYSETGESSGVTDAVCGVKALGLWPHHPIG